MISVERAVSTDSLVIERLDSIVWNESSSNLSMSDSNYTWRIWIENAMVTTVKKHRKIVGVALVFPLQKGEYCLHKIFVHPHYRENHFATQLLDSVLHETDKLRVSTMVHLFSDNQKALTMFEKHGYFPSADRTDANRITNTIRLTRSPSKKPFFSANNYLASIYSA